MIQFVGGELHGTWRPDHGLFFWQHTISPKGIDYDAKNGENACNLFAKIEVYKRKRFVNGKDQRAFHVFALQGLSELDVIHYLETGEMMSKEAA